MNTHPFPISIPEDLTVKSGEVIVITVGSFVTLYLQGCHEADLRHCVATVVENYLTRWGPQIRWSKHPKTARWHRFGSKRLPDFGSWIETLDPDYPWEFAHHGGEHAESASPYLIEGFGTPRWQGGFGYVRIVFPPEFSLATPEVFVQTVTETCAVLKPWHGYGGLGLIESRDIAVKQTFEPQVTILAERFSGIEVDVPIYHVSDLRDAIKGANWLTILANPWLDQIPGWEALAEGEPTVMIRRYPGGVILQAGPRPMYGDLTIEPLPLSYIRVAHALQAIRVKNYSSFHMAGEQPRMHNERTQRWLCRFD